MTIVFKEKSRDKTHRAKLEALCYGHATSNRWVKLNQDGFFNNGIDAKLMWQKHRKSLIKQWADEYPGTRPFAFWVFEPQEEKRKRLGGKGDCIPDHVEGETEEYWKGLPTYWIGQDRLMMWPELAEYAIDPENPPRFESEAAFLQRLGLLMPGEAEKLTGADFEPELILED
ncbi:MAG: hypothetical protein R6U27_14285 [Desulfobacterales bacterium]